MSVTRIVRRQSMREQLQNLKAVMKESRPLIEADAQLRRAFHAGYRKRVMEEIEEDKLTTQLNAESLEQSVEPGHDTEHSGSAQSNEQPPVGAVSPDLSL